MKKVCWWEDMPEWRRLAEACNELEAAEKAEREAGSRLLASVQIGGDTPENPSWWEARQSYLEAVETREAAFAAWERADGAFRASPVGQARSRWLARLAADPVARQSAVTTKEEIVS
ncbi:hypothetical protein NYR54_04925 [Chelativorans sp. SCAU2101]|uniref:Uncharacterized protein n=1 Tax=Chelativorans petroleitrophicus TaxID=2975484 RepID=A0A9X2X7Q9_9HYPH|nr:hypothetical protein [Chelativorans petroleitrophicus]MCT8989639.1 hypothetical protein [Chelativorans petroleitrophicus]